MKWTAWKPTTEACSFRCDCGRAFRSEVESREGVLWSRYQALTRKIRLEAHEDLHNCDFSCAREACIKHQRDELWQLARPIYIEVQRRYAKKARMTFAQTMTLASKLLEDLP